MKHTTHEAPVTGSVWQRSRRRARVVLIVGLVLWITPPDRARHVAAQEELAPLSYTVEQAGLGRIAYLENCAACHGENMDDGEFVPLKGVDFRERQVPSLDLFQLFLEDPNGITVELNYFGEDGK